MNHRTDQGSFINNQPDYANPDRPLLATNSSGRNKPRPAPLHISHEHLEPAHRLQPPPLNIPNQLDQIIADEPPQVGRRQVAFPSNAPQHNPGNDYHTIRQADSVRDIATPGNTGVMESISIAYQILIILCIIFYVFNHFISIAVGVFYAAQQEYNWAIATLILALVGRLVVNYISRKWYLKDAENSLGLKFAILGMAPRYVQIISATNELNGLIRNYSKHLKRTNPTELDDRIRRARLNLSHEEFDASVLRVVETFLVSAPQLILQFAIWWSLKEMGVPLNSSKAHGKRSELREQMVWLCIILITVCISEILLTLIFYNRVIKGVYRQWLEGIKGHLDFKYATNIRAWIAFSISLLSNLFFLASRIIALTALLVIASPSPCPATEPNCTLTHHWPEACLAVTLHIFAVFIWHNYEGSNFSGEDPSHEVIFRLIMSFVLLFYYLPLKGGNVRKRLAIFHVMFLIENIAMGYIFNYYSGNYCTDSADHKSNAYIVRHSPGPGWRLGDGSLIYDEWVTECTASFNLILWLTAAFWLVGATLNVIYLLLLDPERRITNCYSKQKENTDLFERRFDLGGQGLPAAHDASFQGQNDGYASPQARHHYPLCDVQVSEHMANTYGLMSPTTRTPGGLMTSRSERPEMFSLSRALRTDEAKNERRERMKRMSTSNRQDSRLNSSRLTRIDESQV